MARLKITIEGEMSPEEMKRYIMAAWGNLPRDIAISEVDTSEPNAELVEALHATSEIAPPVPVAPPVVPEPTPAVAEESLAQHLGTYKKLCDVLAAIVQRTGKQELSEVTELCRSMQHEVPILERLGAGLEDRVKRTWEGMK